jgi:hypothetical protein
MLNPKLLAIAALAAGLAMGATASTGIAQETGNPAPQPNAGMMGGGMMGGGMMGGNMPMMGQMNRMMENCNRMMESMMQRMPNTPSAPSANSPEKKG